MTATNSLRFLALKALDKHIKDTVTRDVDDGDKVIVTPHDPGDDLAQEAIFVIAVDGNVAGDELSGNTDLPTDDGATITYVIRSALDGAEALTAMDRVDRLYVALRRVVMGEELGHDLDGLDAGDGTGQVTLVEIDDVDGPYAYHSDRGYVGLYTVEVRVETNETTA